jgi:hypothetical protein
MMNKIIAYFFLLLSMFIMPAQALADIHNAATCSDYDVMTAINASSDGDTVTVPAGNCTWDGNPYVTLDGKNITLQGAGIGSTNITTTVAGAIRSTTSNTKAFRVTGFKFTSNANFGVTAGGIFQVRGGTQWRIDNNRFEIYSSTAGWDGGAGIVTWGDMAGLVDHNQFVNHPSQLTSGSVFHVGVNVYGGGGSPSGVARWQMTSQLNNFDHTVFIDNNYFREAKNYSAHPPHAVYAQYGGIYVLRHNEIRNMNIDAHGFEINVSTREYDINNNDIIVENGIGIHALLWLRGGTGVVWNNDVSHEGSGFWNYFAGMSETRISANRGNKARPELYGGIPALE